MFSTLERFLKYVTYDTQSTDEGDTVPSTPGQRVLAEVLGEELRELGLKDVEISEHAYVTATLESNLKGPAENVPAIGFIAHMDTATEVTGKDVKPRVVKNYAGGDIVLNEELSLVLSPRDFPFMEECLGQDLVVTDGTTLLGADNKAGVAEIMGALDYLVHHPEVEHGTVKVAFTPDEEVGHLARLLDIEKFGADFAYTLDAGPLGEICYENFNAANAVVKVRGRAVHPGKSKGIMVNAVELAQEFNALFPPAETPATTEKYEGYYLCMEFQGTVEEATLKYLIRDHDREKFEARKEFMAQATAWMNQKYGEERFTLTLEDKYYNMLDKVAQRMDVVETALEAMKELDIEPRIIPMRGGTDGAALSWRGLVTPNFFAGGYNHHGKFEFVPVQSMEKATRMVLKILELYVRKARLL